MLTALLVIAVFWLAYSNGANDNFKGVATLYGCGAASYRTALIWTTGATVAGSLVSIILAGALAESFSGKGLLPDDVVTGAPVLLAVGSAAAITILLATVLGMPTSTTHALIGALMGISLLVSGAGVAMGSLRGGFFQPLLISPLLAIAGAAILYTILHRVRLASGVARDTCLCIGSEVKPVSLTRDGAATVAIPADGGPTITLGPSQRCVDRYGGRLIGVSAQTAVDSAHYLSAASVSFARAVNDTPKIAALLLAGGAAGAAGVPWQLALVAAAMAAGGLLSSRRIAETMSHRITGLNPGQGLTGNLVTAGLVLGASSLGAPVSTTHVSVGSLFGIGAVSGQARWGTIARILLTWVTTLPMGAVLGAAIYFSLTALGA